MRLKEKIALITGGANGIGLATTERFVKEGAKIILWDVSDQGKGVAARLKKEGHEVIFRKVSVTDMEQVQKAVDLLNHRPRKVLEFRTPFEVYFGKTVRYTKPPLDVAFRI